MENYLLVELIKWVTLCLIAFFLGLWVSKKNIKVNYTRKVFHFFLFFITIFLESIFPYKGTVLTIALSGGIFLICISTLAEPFRKNSFFLRNVFASIDRPEDQPYTLLWISTQLFTTYMALIIMLMWFTKYHREPLLFIVVLIAAIGDGLAEPVGIKLGRHKYKVRALFTKRSYTRSFEGSLCVFLSGILAIIVLKQHLSPIEFLLAMVIIPLGMTLVEALSPHTWDEPFLYIFGGLFLVGILELARTP